MPRALFITFQNQAMKIIELIQEFKVGDLSLEIYHHYNYKAIRLAGAYAFEIHDRGEFLDSEWGFSSPLEAITAGQKLIKELTVEI